MPTRVGRESFSTPAIRDTSTVIAVAASMTVTIRRLAGEEAEGLWRQLLQGGWSIVERFDDAGRSVVLALRTGEPPPRPWHLLTARERGIIAAVAAGNSNREIAADLGVSISTVAGHLRAARRKLGGMRRIELAREWRAVTSTK
jgi:DNA-binding CsgD family transcriptional regulator